MLFRSVEASIPFDKLRANGDLSAIHCENINSDVLGAMPAWRDCRRTPADRYARCAYRRLRAFAQAAPLKSFPPTLHWLSPYGEPVHRIGRDTDLFSNKTESAFSMYAYTPRSNQFLTSPPQKGTPMQRLHDRAQSARGTALAAIIVGCALATAAQAQTS